MAPVDRTKPDGNAPKTRDDDSWRCVWVTNGRRCWLPGGMSPHIGDGRRSYCHWHFVALTSPRDVDDYREFIRWSGYSAGYCSVENHHPLEEIWDAIQGVRPITSDPTPCKAILCTKDTDSRNIRGLRCDHDRQT